MDDTHGINLRLFIPSVTIIIGSVILIFTHSTSLVLGYVRHGLSFYRELRSVFWVITAVCGVCYYVSTRKTDIGGKDLFVRLLGPIPDLTLSVITYGMMFHTAITMLNGIFKQRFYDYVFIKDIHHNDLLIIAIPMIGFLFWSIIQIYKLGVRAYAYSKPGGQIRKAKKQSGQEG